MITKHKVTARLTAIAAIAAIALSGCAANKGSTTAAPKDDPKAPIVVWTDATREAGFQQFAKENPKLKLDIQLIGADYLTKLQAYNAAGSGWPDIIFVNDPNNVAQLISPPLKYAAPLDDLVPADIMKGFGKTNDICKAEGKTYCLRNDAAPVLTWYNKKTFEDLGYTVPTTWDELESLSEKVAAENPGYVLGLANALVALSSVDCPLRDVTGPKQVHIDATAPGCQKVAKIIDKMVANGTMLTTGFTDPATVAVAKAGKLLMLQGANWYGEFIFKPEKVYGVPAGELAAAAPLKLDAKSKAYSAADGGGLFMMSSHAKNRSGALKVMEFMTTDAEYQKTQPAYPAYQPAAKVWAEAVEASDYYAESPIPVFDAQAQLFNPVNEHATTYSVGAALGKVLNEALRKHEPIAPLLEKVQTELVNQATVAGYTVK